MSGDPFSNENKAHSIMIESFNGDATFKMDLNGDHQKNDMIYLKKAQGNISVFLNSIVTAEDIGDTGLRFATVGKGSNVNINSVFAVDEGDLMLNTLLILMNIKVTKKMMNITMILMMKMEVLVMINQEVIQ